MRLIDADALKAHYAWWGDDSEKKIIFDQIIDIQPTKSFGEPVNKDEALWNLLKKHIGHTANIVYYGDYDDPVDICLECEDCGEIILDAELYTLCARTDI